MKRALLVAAALGLLPAGCRGGARSPEGAVRALTEASISGDRDEVWSLLGPATRARLESDARGAAKVAGRRDMRPAELLAVGWSAPRYRLDDLRERSRSDDRAEVEVLGAGGERERVDCVRERGAWKVELR